VKGRQQAPTPRRVASRHSSTSARTGPFRRTNRCRQPRSALRRSADPGWRGTLRASAAGRACRRRRSPTAPLHSRRCVGLRCSRQE
jgi:hypothetical protein